ncbi:hypothetical protein TNCV_4267141 [Trichonephila clavipes]|nr:hypothetical protein TNCV_4267141 [Trichonephila clavipes]
MTWKRNRNPHELSDNTAEKNIRSLENLMIFSVKKCRVKRWLCYQELDLHRIKLPIKEYVCTPLNEISGDPATAAALVNGFKSIDNKVACIFVINPIPAINVFQQRKCFR